MTDAKPSLTDLAASGHYDALEEQWLELSDAPPDDPTPFVEAARALRDRGAREQAAELLSLILPRYESCPDAQKRVALFEVAADCDPDDLSLRRHLIQALRDCYPDSKGIRAFIHAADVENAPQPSQAIANMREMLRFDVGCHVYHQGGWGVGKVVGVRSATSAITIDFENNLGHSIPLSAAASLIEPVNDDDFRALCFSQLDKVKALAKDDPAALFISLLKCRGGRATMRQVKNDLLGKVIPQSEWSKWWPSARRALRDAPLIDMTNGNAPDFALRDKPVTPEEALAQRFKAAKQDRGKIAVALECLARLSAMEDPQPLLRDMGETLVECAARHKGADPSLALEIMLVVERLAQSGGQADIPDGMGANDLIDASDDVAELLQLMAEEELRRDALERVRERRPNDWPGVWAWMLVSASASTRDTVVRELAKAGQLDALQSAIAYIMEDPRQNADAMMWLWRRAGADKLPYQFDAKGKAALFEKMLRLVDDVYADKDNPDDAALLAKLRGSIAVSNFDIVDNIAESLPGSEVRRLHGLVTFTRGLTDAAKATVLHVLELTSPEEFIKQLKPWEETATYTTAAGLDRRHKELVKLTTEDYKKITTAIGEAAAMGDISDNAEFQSAIEARGQLTQKAAKMKAEIDNTKIITPHIVPEDEVGIGSRIEAKDLTTGEVRSFTFLGPWDADPDAGILSYRAPFAMAFLGKSVGDIVEVESSGKMHRFEILSTACAV